MTTTLRSKPSPSTNGSSPPDRFDLEPPRGGPARSQWPEITLGLLVVGVFALTATWFYSSTSDREPIVAVRNPIERGQQISAGDLMVVDVASDQAINALPSSESGQVLGRTALVDLAPGTLMSADLYADQALIAAGNGVVGLALDPGEYPTLTLGPGDRVRIVETPRGTDDAEVVLVDNAEVIDVAPIGVQNQLFVSLSMATTEADAVVSAASQDRVRLVQVAGS
ncbi:MAG: hypothetical protein GY704_04685 [Phycisphaeraceae bacterium]|nr:hypothetical protein [Phycisphaeraceae bacterium]